MLVNRPFHEIVEFTRASTATGTGPTGRIYTAAIDEPRFVCDPVTGKSEGLLVEGQATNLLLWSEDFDNSIWLKSGVSVSQSSELDPSGGTKAFHIQWSGSSGGDRLQQSMPASENTEYTLSVWAKLPDGVEEGRLNLNLRMTGGDAEEVHTDFELSNEWRRYEATINSGNNTTALARLVRKHGVPSINVLLWGAQLEEGTHPTSYIPTEGSQVTRAADSTSIPTNAFPFNWRAGTLVFDRGDAPFTGSRFTVAIGESASNYLAFDYGPGSVAFFQPFAGIITGSNSEPSDPHKYAASWEVLSPTEVSLRVARDGVIVNAQVYEGDTSLISLWDKVSVGSRFGTYVASSLMVKGLTIYPRALSNEQLQALTS